MRVADCGNHPILLSELSIEILTAGSGCDNRTFTIASFCEMWCFFERDQRIQGIPGYPILAENSRGPEQTDVEGVYDTCSGNGAVMHRSIHCSAVHGISNSEEWGLDSHDARFCGTSFREQSIEVLLGLDDS